MERYTPDVIDAAGRGLYRAFVQTVPPGEEDVKVTPAWEDLEESQRSAWREAAKYALPGGRHIL